MKDEKTFWASMARCEFCGRFIKRGLFNWTNHVFDECKGKKPVRDETYPIIGGRELEKALDEAFNEYWKQ